MPSPSVIAHLRGLVLEKAADAVVLDVAGVGYSISLTAGATRNIPSVGVEVSLRVHSHWNADTGPQLFGFVDNLERHLFRTLITVKGVGPKAALSILSSVQSPELVQAIVAGDVVRLSQVRGIGKKTAERLCVELRDKLAAEAAEAAESGRLRGPAPVGPPLDDRIKEVAGYLEALQLRPDEYRGILPRLDVTKSVADLVRDVLAELRTRNPRQGA